MPPLSFPQDSREVAPAKRKALLNSSGYCQFGIASGDAKVLAEHPELACAVVHFKHACAHGPEGIHHSSGDGNFLAREASRIPVDAFNRGPLRTSREHYTADHDDQGSKNSITQSLHTASPVRNPAMFSSMRAGALTMSTRKAINPP
jgi:hypothetical protein